MTPSEVFSIASKLAIFMWVLMVFLPKWSITRFFIDYKIIPIILSIVYVIYIIQAMQIGGMMDFGSLKSVMALFTEQNVVLAGWVHYLAFDLLIGMWILNQNQTVKIHHLLIIPCLLATFMFGPIGFLLFTIMSAIKLKKA